MLDEAKKSVCACGGEVDEDVLFERLDNILDEYRNKDGGLIPVCRPVPIPGGPETAGT